MVVIANQHNLCRKTSPSYTIITDKAHGVTESMLLVLAFSLSCRIRYRYCAPLSCKFLMLCSSAPAQHPYTGRQMLCYGVGCS